MAESEETIMVCRLCERPIPAAEFSDHSDLCLIGNQAAVEVSAIDEKALQLVNELSMAIYATSCNYLKRYVKSLDEVDTEDHLVLSDAEFDLAKDINKKAHLFLAIHDFSDLAIENLETISAQFETLMSSQSGKMQSTLREIAQQLRHASKDKLMQLRSSYGACVALAEGLDQLQQGVQIAQAAFGSRYSSVMPSIDDFELIKPISKGAFGQVFLARKRKTGDYFAVKIQKKSAVMRKKISKRVNDEHKILADTDNPFIVKLYYSFQSEDNLFLVMEYLPGGDCLSLIEKLGSFGEEMTRFYIAETVLALKYLHNRGIIHRDMKPDNMLINSDGHVKLTDFGLSVYGVHDMIHGGDDDTATDRAYVPNQNKNPAIRRLTRREKAYSCVGTPDYLAPEVLRGIGHDESADWWSVGAITYEFLTGLPPFTSDSADEVFRNVLHQEIEWPEDIEISDTAKDFVKNLLVRDPTQRLGSRAEGVLELQRHPFFEGLDWDNVYNQEATFKPCLQGDDDTSYGDLRAEMHKSVEISLDSLKGGISKSSPELAARSPRISSGGPGARSQSEFGQFQLRHLGHLADQNLALSQKRNPSPTGSGSNLHASNGVMSPGPMRRSDSMPSPKEQMVHHQD
eukprot:TRINITY_DN9368_c0_g1_i1.p1 TRINITY_DN9368_c0_g1~~TRINITY_DN9368_c0_g1_i1.p1  ORF type:complete len:627 (-),score=161.64 TRINITY_DN9368_c0_g1_i1:43-1923(-)